MDLLAILERIGRIAGRRVQRLGLSATIGNPESLLDWLACGEEGDIIGQAAAAAGGEVTIDHVGSLENAAVVLSRLYRGEKRLVFCDSRARVETLAAQLHERGVETFVSHSSLAAAKRRRAEEAFANVADCVIVATSTLELGIDVGDLDRVVQIDAPRTVSAFLQRMGRTGRRLRTTRNCLFLATSDEAFLETIGIARLWDEGFVEPITPPPLPLHLLAQQVMALILQQGGLGRREWRDWIGRAFREIPEEEAAETIGYMLASGILSIDNGILGMGRRGEAVFGGRNFLELVSAFTTPLLLTVRHGATELGQIDPTIFRETDNASPNLLLAGRSWKVTSVDWRRRTAYVEPALEMGRSRWLGSVRGLHFDLAQGIERAIAARAVPARLSRRASQRFAEVAEQFPYCDGQSIPVVRDRTGRLRWWTFAGTATNQMLASALQSQGAATFISDDLGITTAHMSQHDAVARLERITPANICVQLPTRAVRELKFIECLQERTAERVLNGRLFPTGPFAQLTSKRLRFILSSEA